MKTEKTLTTIIIALLGVFIVQAYIFYDASQGEMVIEKNLTIEGGKLILGEGSDAENFEIKTGSGSYISKMASRVTIETHCEGVPDPCNERNYYDDECIDGCQRKIECSCSHRSCTSSASTCAGCCSPQNIWDPGPCTYYEEGHGINSFSQDTEIKTITGIKEIKEIEEGDIVQTFNLEREEMELSRVVKTFEREAKGYYVLNGHVKVTGEHQFYTNRGWIEARKLRENDLLFNGEDYEEIAEIRKVDEPLRVYNFDVEKNHNYFAEGLLVHNVDTGECLNSSGADCKFTGGCGGCYRNTTTNDCEYNAICCSVTETYDNSQCVRVPAIPMPDCEDYENQGNCNDIPGCEWVEEETKVFAQETSNTTVGFIHLIPQANEPEECDAFYKGSIYMGEDGYLYVCDGEAWVWLN